MNENENNNINQNDNNNINQGENAQTSPEDTKAFNWEWTDGDDSEAKAQSNEAESDDIDTERPDIPSSDRPIEPKVNEQPKKNSAAIIAAILSSCSIVLIVAFAMSLMLGIFPVSGRETVIIGVSNSGQTQPDTEASPDLIDEMLRSTVVVKSNKSTGSGVIIDPNGYIVTNYHVISGAKYITVQLYGEKIALKAKIIGYHEDDDIAVIKVDSTKLHAASFAKSSDVRYGERVYTIGTPEGVEFRWTVTQGIVSSPYRELMVYGSDGAIERKISVVQTDAPINHGNSGGPLFNARGEIIGIIAMKRIWSVQSESLESMEPIEGFGFALPADGVLVDAEAIIRQGHANNVASGITLPRPLIGVTGVGVDENTYYKTYSDATGSGVKVVTEEYAKANPKSTFYAPVSGVHVTMTSEGFDSSKNLRSGDIITEINGMPISSISELSNVINQYNSGDTVMITYYRDGKYSTAELALRAANETD